MCVCVCVCVCVKTFLKVYLKCRKDKVKNTATVLRFMKYGLRVRSLFYFNKCTMIDPYASAEISAQLCLVLHVLRDFFHKRALNLNRHE